MIRNKYLSISVATATIITSPAFANRMVTNTKEAINSIHSKVIQDSKEKGKKIRSIWKGVRKLYVKAVYDENTAKNADIAESFFKTFGEQSYLRAVGSQEDIDYLRSVFTEFYDSGERTMFRLVKILHNHMMAELGLDKTLEQFKKMMKETHHNHRPKSLNANQFEIYCKCVARGLYAVYWFEHGQK